MSHPVRKHRYTTTWSYMVNIVHARSAQSTAFRTRPETGTLNRCASGPLQPASTTGPSGPSPARPRSPHGRPQRPKLRPRKLLLRICLNVCDTTRRRQQGCRRFTGAGAGTRADLEMVVDALQPSASTSAAGHQSPKGAVPARGAEATQSNEMMSARRATALR